MTSYKVNTLPVLMDISHKSVNLASCLENGIDLVSNLLNELTEISTKMHGQHQLLHRQSSLTERVNQEEYLETDKELREMISKMEQQIRAIEIAEDEFARILLSLPGALNLLSTTAADRATSVLHDVSKFFRKTSEKVVRWDIFGVVKGVWKELKNTKDKIVNWYNRDDSHYDDGVMFAEDAAASNSEPNHNNTKDKELLLYIKVLQTKSAVDTMCHMLTQDGKLSTSTTNDMVWETQAKIEANRRATNRVSNCDDFDAIVCRLHDVCHIILQECKAMNPSPEKYQEVMAKLLDNQEQLEKLAQKLKSEIGEGNQNSEDEIEATQGIHSISFFRGGK